MFGLLSDTDAKEVEASAVAILQGLQSKIEDGATAVPQEVLQERDRLTQQAHADSRNLAKVMLLLDLITTGIDVLEAQIAGDKDATYSSFRY